MDTEKMDFEERIESIKARVKFLSYMKEKLEEEFQNYEIWYYSLRKEINDLEREAKGKNLKEIRTLRREIERIEPYGSEDVAMAYA